MIVLRWAERRILAEDVNSRPERYSNNGRQISPRNESLTGGVIRAAPFVAEAAGPML